MQTVRGDSVNYFCSFLKGQECVHRIPAPPFLYGALKYTPRTSRPVFFLFILFLAFEENLPYLHKLRKNFTQFSHRDLFPRFPTGIIQGPKRTPLLFVNHPFMFGTKPEFLLVKMTQPFRIIRLIPQTVPTRFVFSFHKGLLKYSCFSYISLYSLF